MLGLGLLFSGSQPIIGNTGPTISLLHADDLITADTVIV
ncbi:hypothetical protein C357_10367 [Citreicella sp. 357]|nr:hypothetical protein C357_10367 [Citreicella sp. 357]